MALDPLVVNRDDIVQRTRCIVWHGGSLLLAWLRLATSSSARFGAASPTQLCERFCTSSAVNMGLQRIMTSERYVAIFRHRLGDSGSRWLRNSNVLEYVGHGGLFRNTTDKVTGSKEVRAEPYAAQGAGRQCSRPATGIATFSTSTRSSRTAGARTWWTPLPVPSISWQTRPCAMTHLVVGRWDMIGARKP